MDAKFASELVIKLTPGSKAVKYPEGTKELRIVEANICEQGMESGLPLVDLILEDEEGNRFFAVQSGRIFNQLSAVLKGVNMRNHGIEEP